MTGQERRGQTNIGPLLLFLAVLGGLGYAALAIQGSMAPAQHVKAAAESARTFSGTASTNTAQFHLNGGIYQVSWTAKPANPPECFHAAHLNTVGGDQRLDIGGGGLVPSSGVSDHTTLYGVTTGDHYVEVNSGCSWTVTIQPR